MDLVNHGLPGSICTWDTEKDDPASTPEPYEPLGELKFSWRIESQKADIECLDKGYIIAESFSDPSDITKNNLRRLHHEHRRYKALAEEALSILNDMEKGEKGGCGSLSIEIGDKTHNKLRNLKAALDAGIKGK